MKCGGSRTAKLSAPTPGMIGVSYLDLAYHFTLELSIRTSDNSVITSDILVIR